jgi:glycosyltransferase involved in cell wall biosynthesis
VNAHIICAVHNGARYLDDLFRSLQAQTVSAWRCFVRDDGSTDGTADAVRRWSTLDSRIVFTGRSETATGAASAFGTLLTQLPDDHLPVACVDHDDVWLPHRLERSLDALHAAERARLGPVLVHSDLEVVDDALHPLHASFWRVARVFPEPTDLPRITVDNVVTGSTITMNRALVRELGAPPSSRVRYQDHWFALAASAFGRIVAINEPTVRYRQHVGNTVGAAARSPHGAIATMRRAFHAFAGWDTYRQQLARGCALAEEFVGRFGERLSPDDRAFLSHYAAIPSKGALERKWSAMTMRARPGRSLLQAAGEFLRA